ncbi:3'-5' exonuclease [Pedobacter sp. HMF7647]|uniref:3'-5' exonuclease n=1 Tax=Hufsiella arboris TaxID=2695275 RepID=A0A7K1Y7V3_9SPHI|nr:3'-5' exonuclease [Hufsiella arboris]MXV50451.1 3'-5' exonuclease [Hufsiella arboris]
MLNQIDLQQVLVLDIETVPQYANFSEVPPHLSELWNQKSLYKRKENETAEEYYSRAGIWAEFGKIVCISVGAFTRQSGKLGFRVKSFFGHDEAELLHGFIDLLNKQPAGIQLCAHNGKEFDFPYLCRRMLINCIPIPEQLQISGKKPWEINHLDTMELWKFGDYKNYTSLNLLAAIFNIPTPKDDITGADVQRVYWNEGDVARIKTYCQKDVITTAQLLLRFRCQPLIADENITIVE